MHQLHRANALRHRGGDTAELVLEGEHAGLGAGLGAGDTVFQRAHLGLQAAEGVGDVTFGEVVHLMILSGQQRLAEPGAEARR